MDEKMLIELMRGVLREEQRSMHEELQLVHKEQRGVREELQLVREEQHSMCEDLQSIHEEQHSMREDLQSIHEEQHSMNERLDKIDSRTVQTSEHVTQLIGKLVPRLITGLSDVKEGLDGLTREVTSIRQETKILAHKYGEHEVAIQALRERQ